MSQYTDGKVTVTTGSSSISGSDTLWLGNVPVGSAFKVLGEDAYYNINSVDDNGTIQISPHYAGASKSDVAYVIHIGITARGFFEITDKDLDWFFFVTLNARRADQLLGFTQVQEATTLDQANALLAAGYQFVALVDGSSTTPAPSAPVSSIVFSNMSTGTTTSTTTTASGTTPAGSSTTTTTAAPVAPSSTIVFSNLSSGTTTSTTTSTTTTTTTTAGPVAPASTIAFTNFTYTPPQSTCTFSNFS